jgi:tetratricopeptide (TPR) repeat protein
VLWPRGAPSRSVSVSPWSFDVRLTPALVAFALIVALAAPLAANPRSEALRREAFDAAFNLDYDRAVDLFKQAVAADPNDAASWRGAASVYWLRILFLRGTVLVEDYLGHIKSSADAQMPVPPPALDAAFHQSIDKAVALGERSVDGHYQEAWAHYDLSAALGLNASYAGSVEGRLFGAMKLARRSFSEAEMVMQLDPKRKDAGLVLGTYRYLVSTLPATVRWMAYIVGFSGGKEEGLRLIEGAASYPSDVQTDARFALVLLYNRERRYADAINVVRGLERSYPQNRLLQLEEASTALRAGRPADALRVLDDGIARLQHDTRPRMTGEEARWYLKRGSAHLQLGMLAEADADLKIASNQKDVRGWVRARIHVARGKLADLRGDRARAQSEYKEALQLTATSSDEEAETEATRYLSQPYRK